MFSVFDRLEIGTQIVCIAKHQHGNFTVGATYKINAHKSYTYQGGVEYAGVRIRDDKRQRKDFNFIPTSKNFIWNYFKLREEV